MDIERYEIEGLYPMGTVSQLLSTDPSQWDREWRLWHWTPSKYEAKMTLRAGNYLRHRTCPISYIRLRVVRVTKHTRKVIDL